MYNICTQKPQHLMVLLSFMILEYPLILEIHLRLFQKKYNSLIKTLLKYGKKGKALKRWGGEWSEPNNPPSPHPTVMLSNKVFQKCFVRLLSKQKSDRRQQYIF